MNLFKYKEEKKNVDEEERQHLFREYTVEDAFNKIMDVHT